MPESAGVGFSQSDNETEATQRRSIGGYSKGIKLTTNNE